MNQSLLPRAQARRIRPSAPLVFSCLSLLAVAPLGAQTTAPTAPENEVVVLSPFTVSAESADRYRAGEAISAVRVRAPLLDTASSISVITRDMIDDLAPGRVFDVTRYVAGVQEGRGIQFQDRMIIRGFETQNGARTVDNFLQSADADNVEESIIDRIEVSKGPNAILSPAGAPGGSVNIITKAPSFRPSRTLTLQLGQFNAQKATLDVGGPIADSKSLAYRLVGSHQDTRTYWSSSAKNKNSAVAPMITWRISDQTQFTAKLVAAQHEIFREPALIIDPATKSGTVDPKLAPGFGYNGLNGTQTWSAVKTDSLDLFANLTTTINENLSVRVAANARRYNSDSDQEFVNGLPGLNNRYNPYTGELTLNQTWALTNTSLAHNATTNPYIATPRAYFNPGAIGVRGQIQWTQAETANFQTDAVLTHQLGVVSSQTVVGFGYSRQQGYSRVKDPGTLPAIDLSKPTAYAYPVYPANLTAHNGNAYTNMQGFINQRLGFFENRLYLTGGLLRYSTKTQSWSWNVNTGIANPRSVLDDGKNLWNLSALYKVRDNVSLYASRSINASPVIANNQPLWRSGEQDEIGFKTEFAGGKLSLNGAYFQIAQTNVTVPNPARQNDPTAPEQLVSDLKNKGYEFELMGRVSDNLSVIATYSHLKMRDALGRMVRGVADNNASTLLSYRFTDGEAKGLTLNAGVSYSGKRAGDAPINYTVLNVTGKTFFFLKAHAVDTFGATYRLNDRYTFRLNVDNMFDRKNYLAVAGGVFWGTGLTTATGRNIRFTTTVNW
ncbi:Ferrichrome-iron receptor precursor [Lacunisphaera limnophila]|uniref:Ferrichrome-iron receptor n=1 Tax=Lacunisphaera limnophila TaxID=1838286 RepID=A0A1D8ATY4_9BACT|nr:Ferrichrome-iron receptor precursor [Lacunisphaera limnophila]